MLKGYRTIIFNVVMGVIALTTAIFPDAIMPTAEEVDGLLAHLEGLILAVVTVGNIALRAVTTTPMFKGEK